MQKVISKDGTQIAYDRQGHGPAVILIEGALGSRLNGFSQGLARLLAANFTVIGYDRRGRGDSGDKRTFTVEGEVGRIGTDASKLYTDKFIIKEEDLTKPEEALRFLNETKANLLAVSIGNFHGIEISGIDPNLRLDVLKAIKEKVGNAYLVLHGGSGTPQDDIKEAIKIGIVKININTELRLAFSGNLRRFLSANPDEIVPYKFLLDAEDSVKKVAELKIKLFGSENRV